MKDDLDGRIQQNISELYVVHIGALTSLQQSVMLNLPHLKQLNVTGTCSLFDILKAAPNLDDLIIDFDCLNTLIDDEPTRDLLQQRITRLEIRYQTDIQSDSFQRLIHIFCRLIHLCVVLKSSKTLFESSLSIILAQSNIKQLNAIVVGGEISDGININRQWVVDRTPLTMDDIFVVNVSNGYFILWK